MATQRFDPTQHKRGAGGKFTDMLKNLKPGSAVELPDGVKVRAQKVPGRAKPNYIVEQKHGAQEAATPGGAAKAALNASARNTDPNAVGGAIAHKDFDAAMTHEENNPRVAPQAAMPGGDPGKGAGDIRRLLNADPDKAMRELKKQKIPDFQKRAIRAQLVAEQRKAALENPKPEKGAGGAKAGKLPGGIDPNSPQGKKIAEMQADGKLGAFAGMYKDRMTGKPTPWFKDAQAEKAYLSVDENGNGGGADRHPDESGLEKLAGPKRDVHGPADKPKAGDLKPGGTIHHETHGEMVYMGRNATNHHVARKAADGEGGKKHIIRLKNVTLGEKAAVNDQGGQTKANEALDKAAVERKQMDAMNKAANSRKKVGGPNTREGTGEADVDYGAHGASGKPKPKPKPAAKAAGEVKLGGKPLSELTPDEIRMRMKQYKADSKEYKAAMRALGQGNKGDSAPVRPATKRPPARKAAAVKPSKTGSVPSAAAIKGAKLEELEAWEKKLVGRKDEPARAALRALRARKIDLQHDADAPLQRAHENVGKKKAAGEAVGFNDIMNEYEAGAREANANRRVAGRAKLAGDQRAAKEVGLPDGHVEVVQGGGQLGRLKRGNTVAVREGRKGFVEMTVMKRSGNRVWVAPMDEAHELARRKQFGKEISIDQIKGIKMRAR